MPVVAVDGALAGNGIGDGRAGIGQAEEVMAGADDHQFVDLAAVVVHLVGVEI